MESNSRSFTVVAFYKGGRKLKTNGGRYISSTPSGAAKKAFSQYFRNHKTSARFSLDVYIRETTQNTNHKMYKYKISKINESNTIERNGQKIQYEYKIKVKSLQ